MVSEPSPKELTEQSLLDDATPFQLDDEGVDSLSSCPHHPNSVLVSSLSHQQKGITFFLVKVFWFPSKLLPFSRGKLIGVLGFVLQLIWGLGLLILGFLLGLTSLCLGLLGLSTITGLVQGWYYGYGK
jgi:hypothetical protein